ncbi:MAG: hypothetical protein WD046_14025 [Paracoccaceae bacterium]
MKILVIGNSHTPALLRGFALLAPQCPDVSLTAYAHYHRFFGQFEPDEAAGRIRMKHPAIRRRFIKTHGGDGSFRPLDYDMCIIIGGYWLWAGLALGRFSEAFERAIIDEHIETMHPMVLLRKIRAVSDIPVLIVCNPFMASRAGMLADAQAEPNNGAALINAVLGPRYDARLVTQPPETLLYPRQTKLEYAIGENMWGTWKGCDFKPYLYDDMMHMNTTYGALLMRRILRDLGQDIGEVALPAAEGHLPYAQKTMPAL